MAAGLAVVTDPGTAIAAGALLGGALSALLLACGGAAAGDAAATDASAIGAGRQLYRVHGCAVCHGEHGRGDGPVSRTLRPAPRDFQRPEAFRAPRTVTDLAAVIATGGGSPASGMPAFAHLDDTSRRQMATFVLSLGEGTREST